MVDNLKRFREPVAWAFILLIVGSMALSIARLVLAMTTESAPVFTAFQDIANNAMNLTLVALLIVMVCLCIFIAPPAVHVKALTRWSAIVVTLGTVLTIVATVLGLMGHGVFSVVLELLGGILDIIIKIVACVVLWVIDRAVHLGRMAVERAAEAVPEVASAPVAVESPVWQPGQATGSVWRTAAEAAAGSDARAALPAASALPPSSAGSQADAVAAEPPRVTPVARPGAAEAMGWRRADSSTAPSSTTDPA